MLHSHGKAADFSFKRSWMLTQHVALCKHLVTEVQSYCWETKTLHTSVAIVKEHVRVRLHVVRQQV